MLLLLLLCASFSEHLMLNFSLGSIQCKGKWATFPPVQVFPYLNLRCVIYFFYFLRELTCGSPHLQRSSCSFLNTSPSLPHISPNKTIILLHCLSPPEFLSCENRWWIWEPRKKLNFLLLQRWFFFSLQSYLRPWFFKIYCGEQFPNHSIGSFCWYRLV